MRLRKRNPSTTVWLLLAGIGAGVGYLLLRGKDEEEKKKPVTARPLPPPPQPGLPTVPLPKAPGIAVPWAAWDGCYRPGFVYRAGAPATTPQVNTVLTQLIEASGLTSAGPVYVEGGTTFADFTYPGAQPLCPALKPPLLIQQKIGTVGPLQGARLPVLV